MSSLPVPLAQAGALSPPDMAWMLISCALVLLMVPGVALFYAGMVRSKNALNTIMMCFGGAAVACVVWCLAGYSFAFGGDGRWFGGLEHLGLAGVDLAAEGSIPHLLFAVFQATFAMVAAGCVAGAVVERMRFGAFVSFIALWTLLIYAPICHWVWGGGWLAELGALDFAGGTVVHINAGITAAVIAWVLGPRKDFGRQALLPHSVPTVLLGSGLLWFGWLGFNGGSALAANETAALAVANTVLAPCASIMVWMLLDARRHGQVTAIGAATAIVVGLVAVTPAAGFVSPMAALLIGGLSAVPSYFALLWRARTRLDDSLDVLSAHGLGGAAGALLTGVFAATAWGGASSLMEGDLRQFAVQLLGIVVAAVYSGGMAFVMAKGIGLVVRLRVDARDEATGLDVTAHGEKAYADGEGALLIDAPLPSMMADAPSFKLATAPTHGDVS